MQSSTLPDLSASAEPAISHGKRRRFALEEALPFLITVAAGALCYGLFMRRGIGLSVVGYNVAPAERVLAGEVPYRDFIYNYTPGVLWLNALLMKLLGTGLMSVRIGLFAFKLAALVALYFAARRLTCSRAALIPVALTLGWVGYRYIFRVYPTQYSMLFVLVGVICMLSYDRSGRSRWLVACGASIGAVFVFKQNVGVVLLAAATLAVVTRELSLNAAAGPWPSRATGAAKKAALCWAGFAAVAATAFAAVAASGALGAMFEHFFSLAGEYGDKRSIMLPSPRLLAPAALALLVIGAGVFITLRKAPRLFEPLLILVVALGSVALLVPNRAFIIKNGAGAAIAYLPLALFLSAFAVVAYHLRNNRRAGKPLSEWWRVAGPVVILTLFAAGAYMEMYPRADYSHLVRVLPPVFLLLSVLIARAVRPLIDYFQPRLPAPRRAAVVCAAAPLVLLIVIGIKDTWQPRFDSSLRLVENTPLSIPRARGILVSPKQAEFIEGLSAAIESNSAPDDYIFSFAPRGTAFYFLAARRNPTRFVWWRSVGIKKDVRESLLAALTGRVPKLLLIPEGFQQERIRAEVDANYHPVAAVDDVVIYERNP